MTALIIIALFAVAAYYVCRKPKCSYCGGKLNQVHGWPSLKCGRCGNVVRTEI